MIPNKQVSGLQQDFVSFALQTLQQNIESKKSNVKKSALNKVSNITFELDTFIVTSINFDFWRYTGPKHLFWNFTGPRRKKGWKPVL